MLGLYIHIPFCKKICPYCDFCKTVSNEERQYNYIEALLKELKLKNLKNYKFDTVYIGGGTPSSLDTKLLDNFLKELNKFLDFKKVKEFTIETNPNDLDEDFIKIIANNNINRVSIGVQTFNPKLQKIIDRYINIEDLYTKIELLNKYNINNVNVDMIYAIPTQTIEDLKFDLEILSKLKIEHISYYSLILEEKTIFNYLYKNNKLQLVDENDEVKMFHYICNYLNKYGFKRYETSNFSKKNFQSIHNLIYWNCDEYLSLGASGSSYFENKRFTTTSNISKYIFNINRNIIELDEEIILTKEEQMNEEIILGLRKTKGINIIKFYNKYNVSIYDKFSSIRQLLDEGLLKLKNNRIYIPQKYIYITNHIILRII